MGARQQKNEEKKDKQMFTPEQMAAALQQAAECEPSLIYSAMGKLNAKTARENGGSVGRHAEEPRKCPRCKNKITRGNLSRWRVCPHDGSNQVECKLCGAEMTALQRYEHPNCPHTLGAQPLTPQEKMAVAREMNRKRARMVAEVVERTGTQVAAAEELGMSVSNVNRLVKRANQE